MFMPWMWLIPSSLDGGPMAKRPTGMSPSMLQDCWLTCKLSVPTFAPLPEFIFSLLPGWQEWIPLEDHVANLQGNKIWRMRPRQFWAKVAEWAAKIDRCDPELACEWD